MAILLFLLAVYLAIRSLVGLVFKRRDRLHEMLINHVKESRAEQRKKLRILEFRKRKRMQKNQEPADIEATQGAGQASKAA